jgi:homeobox-leucine zipper protein
MGSTTNPNSDASPDGCVTNSRSVLTIAFQFPYEAHLQDGVAAMARQYVRGVVSAVQRVSIALTPSHPGSGRLVGGGQRLLPGSPQAGTLARWICHSYK